MPMRFLDQFLRALNICYYLEETALYFQKFSSFFIASADGHFIIIFHMIFIEIFDFPQIFLFDGRVQDEQPYNWSLSWQKLCNNFDIPFPLPALPLLEELPLLISILFRPFLFSWSFSGSVGLLTDCQTGRFYIFIAGDIKVVVVFTLHIVVLARNNIDVIDIPPTPLGVLIWNWFRILWNLYLYLRF